MAGDDLRAMFRPRPSVPSMKPALATFAASARWLIRARMAASPAHVHVRVAVMDVPTLPIALRTLFAIASSTSPCAECDVRSTEIEVCAAGTVGARIAAS